VICAGVAWDLVLAFIASVMPRRSNTRRIWAPAALSGTNVIEGASSSACLNASALQDPVSARRRGPQRHKPTRATSIVSAEANRARAPASFITSDGTTPTSNGAPDVASLISSGVVP